MDLGLKITRYSKQKIEYQDRGPLKKVKDIIGQEPETENAQTKLDKGTTSEDENKNKTEVDLAPKDDEIRGNPTQTWPMMIIQVPMLDAERKDRGAPDGKRRYAQQRGREMG